MFNFESVVRLFSFLLALKTSIGKEKVVSHQSSDLPFISCEVCTIATKELFQIVSELREAAAYKKLTELKIAEAIEGVCNPESEEDYGLWMRHLDIVEIDEGRALHLESKDAPSKCGVECKTISESCRILFEEEIDSDDLSALLWKNKASSKDIQSKVCSSWSKRCSSKKTKKSQSKINRQDHPYKEITEKDLEIEKMMTKMKAAGMGGMSMYNRDDMDEMLANGGMGGMDGYGDDEDSYGDPYGAGDNPAGEEDASYSQSRAEF